MRCLARPSRTATGFTLVELLVVVAIIALLVAILLPALRRARLQSQTVRCLANLYEIAKGWQMYVDDQAGCFLQGMNVNVNYGGRQGTAAGHGDIDGTQPENWPKPLNRYLGLEPVLTQGGEIYHCPADRGAAIVQPTSFTYFGTSYATNQFLIGQNQRPVLPMDPCRDLIIAINKQLRKLTITRVTVNPANLVLIGDYGWWTSYAFNDLRHFEWHELVDTHGIAFLDGHARLVRFRKGLHVAPDYTVIPFEDLIGLAAQCQE